MGKKLFGGLVLWIAAGLSNVLIYVVFFNGMHFADEKVKGFVNLVLVAAVTAGLISILMVKVTSNRKKVVLMSALFTYAFLEISLTAYSFVKDGPEGRMWLPVAMILMPLLLAPTVLGISFGFASGCFPFKKPFSAPPSPT